jgi:hypothetical protein
MSLEKFTLIENTLKENINVSLEQVETKIINISTPLVKKAEPGEKIQYSTTFNGGCAKMFVFGDYATDIDPSNKLLWAGIIPIGSENHIKISKDPGGNFQVSTDDGKLPEFRDIITSLSGGKIKENFAEIRDNSAKPTWWWVLLFVTLLFGVFVVKNYYI